VAVSGTELISEYHHAFDALPGSIGIIDRTGAVASVNRALEQQFGYARGELVGQSIAVLLPSAVDDIQAAFREPTDQAAGAAARPRQVEGRRKDGSEFSAQIEIRPFETAKGALVVLSITAVSAPPRLETPHSSASAQPLAVELLIADLSSQFINVPADQIEEVIRTGLQRICELLALDRATLVRIGPGGTLVNPVGWTADDVAPVEGVVASTELFPWTIDRLLSGDMVCIETLDDIPNEVDRHSYKEVGTQSLVAVPLTLDGHVGAIVAFSAVKTPHSWPADLVQRLTVIANVFAQVVARQQRDEMLQAAIDEANRLKNQLQAENVFLRHDARARQGLIQIVGTSDPLRHVLAQAEQVASTDSTVLLLGETGTGKELFASYIHSLSARRGRPMVRVNCAAIPATLVESELFGREKGAFTGALARQAGRFELADNSTIFLDEIGDLPLEVQVKLLRVLEERKFERLGSPRPIAIDTRIICATHRSLEQRIAEGSFREDLYYRLNVFPIEVPPLRDRLEDLPALVHKLVEEFSRNFGKRIDVVDHDSLTALQHYSWPGNIRELRNVVERAMIVTTSRRLVITLPESVPAASHMASPKLIDVEREHILAVLKASAWRIRGASGAANRLGMKPTTLETRMAKLGLKRPEHS
jgi:formate hydrogenlyase transcriptional activator